MHSSLPIDAVINETHSPVTACVIWLHGLGADGHDFADIVPQLQLPETIGVRFIFPHAPVRPITINWGTPMRAWYDIHSLADLNQEDRDGIQTSAALINQLIDQQIAAGIPAHRIIVAGFSQGGAMALFAGLRYPQTLGGILALSTYLPLGSELAKDAHAANANIAIFLAHGQFDEILPLRLGKYTRDILQQLGYSPEWHTYAMEHTVCSEEVIALRQWLIRQLA